MGARCLATGVHGAVHNVEINLKQISDEKFRAEIQDQARAEVKKAESSLKQVLDALDARE